MTAERAGWTLVAFAGALVLLGFPQAGLLVAVVAGVLALLAPTEAQADARRRNQARRVR